MDAIRKKMKSLKSETDQLNTVIRRYEEETQNAIARAEQADLDIRKITLPLHWHALITMLLQGLRQEVQQAGV